MLVTLGNKSIKCYNIRVLQYIVNKTRIHVLRCKLLLISPGIISL